MKTDNLFAQQKVETSPQVQMSGFAGEHLLVTHLHFGAGAIGTSHSHPHEQITIVLKGEVEFTLGEERRVLKAGEIIDIPGNTIHGVVALTEAELLDVFTPVRADLLEKLGKQ